MIKDICYNNMQTTATHAPLPSQDVQSARYEKNLAAIQQRDPELYERLTGQTESDETVELTKAQNGQLNLILRRPDLTLPIHSIEDPYKEAEELLANVRLHYPRIVVLLGMGLGYLLEVFLRRKPPETLNVIVIERSLEVFRKTLHAVDLTPVFRDASIAFFVGLSGSTLRSRLTAHILSAGMVGFSNDYRFIGLASALEGLRKEYLECVAAYKAARDYTIIGCGNSVEDSFWGFENSIHNLDTLARYPRVKRIENLFENVPAIVVSAGPSLNKNMEFLRSVGERAVIIAVETCMKPLLDAGIRPHFTVALERSDVVVDLLRGTNAHDVSDIYLIAPPVLMRKAFEAYKGPKFLYTPSYEYYQSFRIPYTGMPTGPSAGNLALGAAIYLGCKPILITGQDLAFDQVNFQSHVNGTIDPNREKATDIEELKKKWVLEWTKGYYGGDVLTHHFWQEFKTGIENTIAHYDNTFYNCTEGGVFLEGAIHEALKPTLEKVLGKSLGVRDRIAKVYQEHSRLRRLWMRLKARRRLKKLIREIRRARDKAIEVRDRIEKRIEEMENLEKQGRPISLRKLNEDLGYALDVKKEFVLHESSDAARILIGLLYPYHMAHEQTINSLPGKRNTDYQLKKDVLRLHIPYMDVVQKWAGKAAEAMEQELRV